MTQLDMITDTIALLEAQVAGTPPMQPATADGEGCDQPTTEGTVLAEPSESRRLRPAKLTRSSSGVAAGGSKVAQSKNTKAAKASRSPRTKKVVLAGLLGRKSGATMAAMMEVTGWQAHSVRAGLSGLRKGGTNIERRTNRKGETVYAIVDGEQA